MSGRIPRKPTTHLFYETLLHAGLEVVRGVSLARVLWILVRFFHFRQCDSVIMTLALVGRDFEDQTWQGYWVYVDDKVGWVMDEYSVVKVPSKHKKELIQFIIRSNLLMDIKGIGSSVP